jgi:Cysteine dioxygenase type I
MAIALGAPLPSGPQGGRDDSTAIAAFPAAASAAPESRRDRLRPEEMAEVVTRIVVSRRLPRLWRAGARSWELVASGDLFEAWAISWPPGGSIELHDHGGSSASIAVVAGQLVENRVVADDVGGLVVQSHTIRPGITLALDGSHVHDIVNVAASDALSVHVYSPRLTSMTYYRLQDGRLAPERTKEFEHAGMEMYG